MLMAFLLLTLAAILGVTALNLPSAARAFALPFPGPCAPPPLFWTAAPVLLALAAGALFARARRRCPRDQRPARDRAAVALLAWPLLFAGMWGWSGADRPSRADTALFAALAGLAALLVARARARGDPLGCSRARFLPAVRRLAAPTTLLATAAAGWGLAGGGRPAPGAVALSLASYPLWSLLQLLVLLALPWPLLVRAGGAGRALPAAIAGLFALAHWPNGPLMLACVVAMLAWARAWARGPSLPAVALAMGLAATALVQFGPPPAFEHARTGPRAVRHRLAAALSAADAVADTTDLPGLVRAFFPPTVGRPAADAEAGAWSRALATRLRERVAWQFLTSDELRARAPDRALPPAARFALPDEPWRGRILALGSPAFRREAGGTDDAFLRALYREILGREAAPGELAGWRPALLPARPQRRALAAALFDARRALRASPGDTLAAARLRLP
jgi:hypothetical protein